MDLCQYSEMLGVPGEGFHRARFLGMAAWDFFGTMFIALLLSMGSENFGKKFIGTFVVLMIIAIFLHWLFCVPTALNKALGLV